MSGIQGNAMPFQVLANSTGVLVEIAWNDTLQDLDAVAVLTTDCNMGDEMGYVPCMANLIASPWVDGKDGYYRNMAGHFGAPDSPSRLVLDPRADFPLACEDPCDMAAGIRLKEATRDIEFHTFVTVFSDGPVPEGYSAIPWNP